MFEKINTKSISVILVLLPIFAVSSSFRNPLLLEGYNGNPRVVLNYDGSELERNVIVACNGFFGPPGGRTTRLNESEVPLPLNERNCLLRCQYHCFKVIRIGNLDSNNWQHDRQFHPENVYNYFMNNTNATEEIAKDFMEKFQRCKEESDAKVYELLKQNALPDACFYYRLFYRCVSSDRFYHFSGKLLGTHLFY
ncbi:hypothetical protein Ocin01_13732 [Orchesella cincta]|uniref:Uncharacterized protein n=1 Tax=Orchesella cincta TaxID=48709 RepID=A0A1D2MJ75_ORCCI|nr:hypothetical protein Ocin01_13732 [Orchesella cincta]